ncbi:hypothetical protein HOS74_gp067 [Gordonia phage Flakey]|uniref:Uncharacterized protein n=1 Tax=Gordonia phage Flakey TaxID=2079280 RepID=A0A2K9VDM3_9CAUD|nr:hypothetical protein HOS74_gp067 [Gordonia phage Flakey]AUV60360.1 hypothetical protein SEA_FLAKEY_65 [Gordonia phage Flakey]
MDGMDMAGMFESMAETVKDPAFQEKVFGHEEVIRHEADTD